MQHYYSPSFRSPGGPVGGFFTDVDHGDKVPTDAVKLTPEEYRSLVDASTAKEIVPGPDGRPIAIERRALPVTPEQRRSERDAVLIATDGPVQRHRDEIETSTAPTLSKEQYIALLEYRQALRDLPQHPGWPDAPLPASPLKVGKT